jgi:type I restriction enzyme M protein
MSLDVALVISLETNEKDIEFEDSLWKAADKLRKKVEVHEYKYIVLGLIFLRYLSFAFEKTRANLEREFSDASSEKFIGSEEFRKQALEDKDYYLALGVLYVPEKTRWTYLARNASQPQIGELLDQAVEALEREYPRQLKDVVPKIYTTINLDSFDYAYLIDVFSKIEFGEDHKDKDIFGRVYEYFLGKFAEAEGKKGASSTPPGRSPNLSLKSWM